MDIVDPLGRVTGTGGSLGSKPLARVVMPELPMGLPPGMYALGVAYRRSWLPALLQATGRHLLPARVGRQCVSDLRLCRIRAVVSEACEWYDCGFVGSEQ